MPTIFHSLIFHFSRTVARQIFRHWMLVVLCVPLASFCLLGAGSLASASDYAVALQRLNAIKDSAESAPSLEELIDIVNQLSIDDQEFSRLYFGLLDLQEPSVSSEEISLLLANTLASVSSVDCRYSLSEDGSRSNFRFAFCEGMVLIEEPNGSEGESLVSSYDGLLGRTVIHKPGAMTNARIESELDLSGFLRPMMPLCQAMLFNAALVGVDSASYSLSSFIDQQGLVAFESPVLVSGKECLVLANLGYAAYLDPAKGYALRKLESYDTQFKTRGDSLGVSIERILVSERINTDFRDCGYGIWLPFKSTLGRQVNTQQPGVEHIEVAKFDINVALHASAFEAIIPDDAFVIDGPRGISYIYGDGPEVGPLLQGSVSPRSSSTAYLLSINALLVVLGLCLWWSKWRLKKQK